MVSDLGIRLPAADLEKQQHEKSVLAGFVDHVQSVFWTPTSESQTEVRDEISRYVSSFGKTAALFAGGRVGRIGTAALFGLDQAHQGDTFGTQALDFGLGVAKGTALRGTFKLTSELGFSPIGTGITLGVSNRFVDGMTDRRNFTGQTPLESVQNAMSKSLNQTFDPKAIAGDAILFGTAHALTGKLNSFAPAGGAAEFMFKSATAGGVFGVSSGAIGEMQRQASANENFDLRKVLFRGALQGGVDATAAGLAGRYNLHLARVDAAATSPVREQAIESKSTEQKLPQSLTNIDRFRMEPRYPSNYAGLRDLLQQPHVEQQTMKGQPQADVRNNPHPDYLTFRASLPDVTKELHVYKPKGNLPEIAIDARHDAKLNEVRNLRQAQEDGRAAGTKEGLLQAAAATRALDLHPLRWELLPEEVIPIIAQAPEFSGIKRVYLSPERNPEDPFYAQKHNMRQFRSEAEMSKDGVLTLFQPTRSILEFTAESPTRDKIIHEWTHTFRWKLGDGADLYDHALQFEKDRRGTDYSSTSPSEDMARNLTDLLHGNPTRMYTVANENPLRSAILSRQLQQTLQETPVEHRSRYHEDYLERAKMIEATATPKAQDQLLEQIKKQDGTQGSAVRLLYELGWGHKLNDAGSLQRLDMAYSPVTDADVAAISSLKPTELSLAGVSTITPRTADAIAGMTGLQRFEAPNTQLDGTIIPALDKLPSLKHVDLRFTQTPYRQIKMWAEQHPGITVRY